MILWYYQIWPKVVWKVVNGLMEVITKTSQKTLTLKKIKVRYFFRAVYHSKKHVTPHTVIASILEVILNILQR